VGEDAPKSRKGLVETELAELFDEKLGPIKAQLDKRERERFALLGLCGICLIIAAASLYFAVSRGLALDDQIDRNQQIVCSQVRSTAVGYRVQLPQETQRAYVDRLLAQRATLLAIGSLECSKVPGFVTFPYLRGRALDDIERILGEIAPKRLREAKQREVGLSDDSLLPDASGSVPSSTTALVPPAPGPVAAPLPGGGTNSSPDQPDPGGGDQGDQGDKGGGGGDGGPPDGPPGSDPSPDPGGGGGTSPEPKPGPKPEPEPEQKPTPAQDPTPEEAVVGIACGVQKGLGLSVTPVFCPAQ
jgi:hypothetical protein